MGLAHHTVNKEVRDMPTEDTWQKDLLPMLPIRLREALINLPPGCAKGVEEIRLRLGQPVALVFSGGEGFLGPTGALVSWRDAAITATGEDLTAALQAACGYSPYAVDEQLRQGFVTLPGGYRVGISGRMLSEKGQPVRLTRPTGLNIRIARGVEGAGKELLPYAIKNGHAQSLLIAGPPRAGKTTMLRDVLRMLSEGDGGANGLSIAVVDERSEIAAGHRLGPRTDVLDACPKATGLMMAIRTLSPQVVATDEIGTKADADAIREAARAGVAVLATVHVWDEQDVWKRPMLAALLEEGLFAHVALISRRKGPGTVEKVLSTAGGRKGEG